MSSLRQVLAIAEVAARDTCLTGADRSAPFDHPSERAAVIRGELLGYLEVTRSERHCLWARITARGSQELHHMRGEEFNGPWEPTFTAEGWGSVGGEVE